MKKISYLVIIFLFLGLIVNNALAAECSGLLINTGYSIVNPPANNIYGVGDTINTQLSFELDGEDGESVSPLSIVLVMDKSGSMSSNMGSTPKIEVAQDALESVVDGIHVLNTPDIKVSLIYFDTNIYNVWPTWGNNPLEPVNSSTNHSSLVTAIHGTWAGGGTSMGAAVNSALNIVNQGDPDSKKVIIVASDGESSDNVSSANQSILKNSVTGYAIGIGNSYNYGQLMDVAGDDSSRVYDANNANQLNTALEDIMSELITFEASDLKVSFNVTDLANTNLSLLSANPNYSSISPDGKILTWNLGNQTDGYVQNISLNFRVDSAIATQLPVNEDVLNFSYSDVDDNGVKTVCSSVPPNGTLSQPSVPVINIFTHEVPTILNFWSNPASGSSMYEGDPLVMSWKTQNADKCISSSSDGFAGWNEQETAAEGVTVTDTVYPIYTGSSWNSYWLQCEKFYDFGGGITKTVYSTKEQVQLQIDPCPPTDVYSCTRTASEDSLCSSSPCGVTVGLDDGDLRCIKTITYPTCASKAPVPGVEPVSVCKNLPGGNICPTTYKCTECKDVDKWIEVAP